MNRNALIVAFFLMSCSVESAPPREPNSLLSPAADSVQDGNGGPTALPSENTVDPIMASTNTLPEIPGEGKPVDPLATPNPVSIPTPTSAPALAFVVDPETLSFPVVFHLGGSEFWKTEEALKEVITETQRILSQAQIEIMPQYTQDANATDFMDVTYVPSVPDNPGVNGISFGGAALEVFVRDKVGLSKVADQRPADAPAVRTVLGAKAGDMVAISTTAALQARTTAHEIGHQLGLPHRQDSTNLLASGTSGWTLNAAEIATMRATATRRFNAKFVPTLKFNFELDQTFAAIRDGE